MTPKQQILETLRLATEPISGEQLSSELSISRTMVWKHVQSLIEEGYAIEAIRKKGYLLNKAQQPLSAESIKQYLHTEKYARQLVSLDSCTSTQKVANEWLLTNSYDGLLIVSEEQTDGKGRLNRSWNSTKGKGLWMSWVIKPNILPHESPPVTLVAALAVAKAIQKITSIQVDIKWPNDLLIDGKKLGGILTELQSTPEQIEAIIVGIGLNVNHQLEDFEPSIQQFATSLALHQETVINRPELLAEIAYQLEHAIQQFEAEGFAPFREQWTQHSQMIGKEITAQTVRETIEGVAVGINEYGALLVETSGGVIPLFSGDVTLSKRKLDFK